MNISDWQDWLVMVIAAFCVGVGVALTVVTLPGAWLIVLAGLGIAIARPDMLPWWVVLILAAVAALGEVAEAVSSAAGASKAGASKKAAFASIVGSIIGAILGIPFLPPLGPIVGGILGAGAAAVAVERWVSKKEWGAAGKVAAGAAIGRLLSMVAKTLVCVAVGVILVLVVAF